MRPGTDSGCRSDFVGEEGVNWMESREPEPELEAGGKGVDWFLVVSSLRVSQEGCGGITPASAFR